MGVENGRLAAEGVRSMFDRIAPVYDPMNRAMTLGLDARWRRLAARVVTRPGDRVLDACCGTGALALAVRDEGGRVTGVDFSTRMLDRARRRSSDVEWVEGDLLDLPFPAASFDAATVGFGVRNVEDLPRALEELRRVLRPGARLAVLELARPSGPLALLYRLWFERLVPLAGRLLPGGDAYAYLPASVRRFATPAELAGAVAQAGFSPVETRPLGGGMVVLVVGQAA